MVFLVVSIYHQKRGSMVPFSLGGLDNRPRLKQRRPPFGQGGQFGSETLVSKLILRYRFGCGVCGFTAVDLFVKGKKQTNKTNKNKNKKHGDILLTKRDPPGRKPGELHVTRRSNLVFSRGKAPGPTPTALVQGGGWRITSDLGVTGRAAGGSAPQNA